MVVYTLYFNSPTLFRIFNIRDTNTDDDLRYRFGYAYKFDSIPMMEMLVQRYGRRIFIEEAEKQLYNESFFGNNLESMDFIYRVYPEIFDDLITYRVLRAISKNKYSYENIENIMNCVIRNSTDYSTINEIFVTCAEDDERFLMSMIASNNKWIITNETIESAIKVALTMKKTSIIIYIVDRYRDRITSDQVLLSIIKYAIDADCKFIMEKLSNDICKFNPLDFIDCKNTRFLCKFFPNYYKIFGKNMLVIKSQPSFEIKYKLCDICMEKQSNLTFKCTHQLCSNCYVRFSNNLCHMCRQEIVIVHFDNN